VRYVVHDGHLELLTELEGNDDVFVIQSHKLERMELVDNCPDNWRSGFVRGTPFHVAAGCSFKVISAWT
jgi:hypothetical protein